MQDACHVQHRRCSHKLYPCAALYTSVCPVGLSPRPPYYTEAGTALLASDSGAYAGVACFTYAEIRVCHRPDSGAVHLVSLLSTNAFYTAAGSVYCAVFWKIGGISPDRKDGGFGRHSGCVVFAGGHQRSASTDICIQQRSAGKTGQLFLFPRSCLLLLPRLDGDLHVFSLILLLKKSRVPSGRKKRLTPFVIGCATVLYGILYLLGLPAVRWWFGDMNVMFCLLYAVIYESCIRCRMIQSNTGYVELFEATTLAACIADINGNIVIRS